MNIDTPPDGHFKERLEHFSYNAPAGTFKVDRYVQTLARARELSIDAISVRKKLWRAAFLSSLDVTDRQMQPDRRQRALEYLKHLQTAAAAMRAASHADHEQLSKALVFVPSEPGPLSQYLSRQNVEREYVELNHFLGKAHDAITRYLSQNEIAPKPKGSNASDHFMRSFIELSRSAWEDEIGRFASRDQKPFAGLLLTALEDFGFTQPPRWDAKFRERVRKQLFDRSKKSIRK
ncbi:hypothetical protein [Bradyrhizobium sp. USDA 4471]